MRGVRFTNVPIQARDLLKFLQLQKTILGYEPERKKEFHKLGHKLAFTLAQGLGLKPDQYEIRHCEGGIGVPGEIILHSDSIYIQFSDVQLGMMYRKVKHRKDYTGERNCWMPWIQLTNLPHVIEHLRDFLNHVPAGTAV